jgi:hypothetical protein
MQQNDELREIHIFFQNTFHRIIIITQGAQLNPKGQKENEYWGWKILQCGTTVVEMKQKWGPVVIIIRHENALRRFCWLPSGKSNNQHLRGGWKTGGESNSDGWGGGMHWGHFYILSYKEYAFTWLNAAKKLDFLVSFYCEIRKSWVILFCKKYDHCLFTGTVIS